MKIAIVYASKTGNTQELVELLYKLFRSQYINVEVYQAKDFPIPALQGYEGVIIGTYTWGKGEVPAELLPIYRAFENQDVQQMTTGVVGTGDSFYPHFCGAVDEFRDMLYIHSTLAVTLKIELTPQDSDLGRCHRFVELFLKRLERKTCT
ncbi:flavodoxin domain-containing protein [Neobacillus muris]|uniref:flavodoxin domain-containing protein n=1 Tax=Neobacillus muris TaxID=2941334 RepID=UPI00203BF019|nr:flavodoxin domain-containing protein [Neobacillus muris]